MERLQAPINPCLFGERFDAECLERERSALEFSSEGIQFVNTEGLRFQEEATASLEEKMPFLEMLRSVESPPFAPFTGPNFELLLRLQHQKQPWERSCLLAEMDSRTQAPELESCVTNDVVGMHSPVKSETQEHHHPQQYSTSCLEVASSECNHAENCWPQQAHHHPKPQPPGASGRERRKRKRTRPVKNKEEVESQRMTHIAVERNRRRQMNGHLNALRSLMPPSYIQRGDQASIIGGAIDFVKELEQLLQSLEAQKRIRKTEEGGVTSSSLMPFNLFAWPLPSTQQYNEGNVVKAEGRSQECTVENKSEAEVAATAAEVEVTVIQTHVNMKIQCPRSPGQLLKAIVALEDLRLTVLHLNITSLQRSVLYCFNLKIEDDCKIGSADEIAAAVHQIFSFINGG